MHVPAYERMNKSFFCGFVWDVSSCMEFQYVAIKAYKCPDCLGLTSLFSVKTVQFGEWGFVSEQKKNM